MISRVAASEKERAQTRLRLGVVGYTRKSKRRIIEFFGKESQRE